MSDRSLVPHAYSQDIKDMAFVHFILQDRHVPSAFRSFLEVWDEEEWGAPPSRKTYERWARKENWDYKADVEMSQNFPGLYVRDIARLVAMRGRSIRAYSRILDGEQLPNAMAIAQVARHVIDLTVTGMAVQAPPEVVGEAGEKSVNERIAAQKARIDRAFGRLGE